MHVRTPYIMNVQNQFSQDESAVQQVEYDDQE